MSKIAHVAIGYAFIILANFVFADADVLTKATVLYCHDGDTCRIKVNGAIWINVRLAGIDAPEVGKNNKGQPLATAARDLLNKTLKDQEVDVRQTDLDAYNRPVVELIHNKQLVNAMLVEQGYAEAYKGKTKRLDKAIYLNAEASAKANKKGIWSLADYVSPADFRKEKRLEKSKN